MRIFHPHGAGIDLQDPPGSIAELKDISGHAFDGKILVDRADQGFTRFQQDAVIGVVRDCAAGSQRPSARHRAGRADDGSPHRDESKLPRRPRRVLNPSASIRKTSSNSSRERSR